MLPLPLHMQNMEHERKREERKWREGKEKGGGTEKER